MIDNRKELVSIENRIGRFNIPYNIIKDPKERDILSILFSKVIIVEATMKFESRSIEYTAISEYFEEVETGLYSPWYNIVIENNNTILFKNKETNKLISTFIKKNPILDRLENIS